MLIRILLCLIAIYACETHELDGRRLGERDKNTQDQKPECLETCDAACEDWGAWSTRSPATNTVCTGQKLTQSQNRTRTCKATCPEVKCLKIETKETEVDGTKACTVTEPQPPCKTSCDTGKGCEEKNYTDWSPAKEEECKDKGFEQTRTWTRECDDTCDDRADCICSNVQCPTNGGESRMTTGTKVTPCQEDDSSSLAGDQSV